MKYIRTAVIATAALALLSPAASAREVVVSPSAGMVFGAQTMSRVEFKVDERQFAFQHRCHSFRVYGVRYTGVRTRHLHCARVRHLIRRPMPRAFACNYLPMHLTYIGQSGTATTYRTSKVRVTCNRQEGRSFALTAHDDLEG